MDYFSSNNIQNIGNKIGFITNNWGMISDDKFNNFGNYILDININKAISGIQKDKFYLSANSIADHSLVAMDIAYNNDEVKIGRLNDLNFSLLDDKTNLLFKNFHNPNIKYTTQLLDSYYIEKQFHF